MNPKPPREWCGVRCPPKAPKFLRLGVIVLSGTPRHHCAPATAKLNSAARHSKMIDQSLRIWMRSRLRLILALVAFSAFTQAAYCAQVEYLPPSLRSSVYVCETGATSHPFPAVSDGEADWFSSQWRAAGEPSLYEQSISPDSRRKNTYRFTWLRSFHAPIIVRIDEDASGNMHLTAKRLTGKGGYAPGRIGRVAHRALTTDERDRLLHQLGGDDLDKLEPVGCTVGLDGAQWILEIRMGGSYHYANRWSPSDGPMRRIGEMFLKLTGFNLEPIY